MKIFGLELKFNGFDIWHKGNFDPATKADTAHNHVKADITDFPSSLPANGGNADTVDGKHASDFASVSYTHHNIGAKNANDLPSTWPTGIYYSTVYNNGFPTPYGTCLTIKGTSGSSITQICQAWPGSDGGESYIWIRAKRNVGSDVWGPWRKLWGENNDGAGSGLDADLLDGLQSGNASGNIPISNGTVNTNLNADLLDGQHASAFAPSGYGLGTTAKRLTAGTDLNTITASGWYDVQNPVNGVSGLTWHSLLVVCSADANYVRQIAFSMTEQPNVIFIRQRSAGTWGSWYRIWNSGNQGSGSGLDADLLDGKHASDFANAVHTHTKSQITDMPTKLSEFENDIGAGAGINIVTSPTEPTINPGDWWFKEV